MTLCWAPLKYLDLKLASHNRRQPKLYVEDKVYQQPAMKTNHLDATEETTETEFQLIIANCVTTD